MLERPVPDKSNSLKTIAEECLKELEALLNDAENVLRKNIEGDPAECMTEEFTKLISDSQQLAADLGTLVEQVKGEDRGCTKRVIEALQGYSDTL